MEQSDAILLAKNFAENYQPPYFTTHEDFQPHAWVVAAIVAAYGQGFDSGQSEGYNDGYTDGVDDGYRRGTNGSAN